MNFLEALEKLKNGECAGIYYSKPDSNHGPFLTLDKNGTLSFLNCTGDIKLTPDKYLGEWWLVNPKPVKQSKVIFKSEPNITVGIGVLKVKVDDSITIPYNKHAKNAVITITWEEHENNPTESSNKTPYSDLPIEKSIIQTIIDDLNKNGVLSQYLKNPRY